MRFAYARRGGPLLDWSGPTSPHQSRAGTTRSLGTFYPTEHTSNALRRYGGMSAGHGGSAIVYEHDRALGSFYPTGRTSNALRRYGGVSAGHNGAAIGYEHDRALGALNIPRPGAPEVVEGYESPEPGAAIVHLGTYLPEGAARNYGQQMLGVDEAPTKAPFDLGLVRKVSVLAAAYHGVKRNNGSVLWGLLWAVAAYVSPLYGVLVPAIGVAQGFGQAKFRSNPWKVRAGGLAARRMKARKQRAARTKKRPSATRRKTALYLPASRPRTRPGY